LAKKVKAEHLHSATSGNCRCSGAVVSQTCRAGIQPTGRTLSLCPQTLTCGQTAIRSPDLPFNGLHSRNHIDYYSFTDPEGMEG